MDPVEAKETIETVLAQVGLYSEEAVALLFGTAAHESGGFKYDRQLGGGPALSYFQIEPATLNDLYENWLMYRPEYLEMLEELRPIGCTREEALVESFEYAICAARLQYLRKPGALPAADDIPAQAAYYKLHWNTPEGKATEDDYIAAFHRYWSDTDAPRA